MKLVQVLGALSIFGGTLSGILPTQAAEPEYTWDMPNAFGRTSSDGVADVKFAELVAEKTNGRIKIVHHFDGSLGYKGVDHLEAVQDGAVPIARQVLNTFGGFDQLFLLSSLPFIASGSDDLKKLYTVYEPHLSKLLDERNQVLVSAGVFPPSGIWSRKPVEKLADLQGLKIRAFDLSSLQTFNGAGAAAVNMNWADVMPALSTGAIDAVVTSADGGISGGLNDYLSNFTEINWAIPITAITVNKDVWNGLSADLQKAVMDAGRETTNLTFDRLATQVGQNYSDMRAKNVNIIEQPNPDLRAKLQEAADAYIKTWREKVGESAKILDEYLAQR